MRYGDLPPFHRLKQKNKNPPCTEYSPKLHFATGTFYLVFWKWIIKNEKKNHLLGMKYTFASHSIKIEMLL